MSLKRSNSDLGPTRETRLRKRHYRLFMSTYDDEDEDENENEEEEEEEESEEAKAEEEVEEVEVEVEGEDGDGDGDGGGDGDNEDDEVIVVHQDDASFEVSIARLRCFPTSYVFLNWSNPGLEHHKNDIHVQERNPDYFHLIEQIYKTGKVALESTINKDDFEFEYEFWFPGGDFASQVSYSDFVQELQWQSNKALCRMATECIDLHMGEWRTHALRGNFSGLFSVPLTGQFERLRTNFTIFVETAAQYGVEVRLSTRANFFNLSWGRIDSNLYDLAMKHVNVAIHGFAERLKEEALQRAKAGFSNCIYSLRLEKWSVVVDGEHYPSNLSIFQQPSVMQLFISLLQRDTNRKFTVTCSNTDLRMSWEING